MELDSTTYLEYIVIERGEKVLYLQILKAIYGMLEAGLLWYRKFRSDLKKEGFEFDRYDSCVANRIKQGSQHTIRFHIDYFLSSHKNSEVNDDFLA